MANREHERRKHARAMLSKSGYAVGGALSGDISDRTGPMIAKGVHQHEGNMHPGIKQTRLKLKDGGSCGGFKSGGRADKLARGGKTKKTHKGTTINIVTMPHGGAPGGPPQMGAAPPPMPPRPPMAPPPGAGAPPPGPGAMPPPGMAPKPPGMMKKGGHVKHKKRALGGGTGVPVSGMPNAFPPMTQGAPPGGMPGGQPPNPQAIQAMLAARQAQMQGGAGMPPGGPSPMGGMGHPPMGAGSGMPPQMPQGMPPGGMPQRPMMPPPGGMPGMGGAPSAMAGMRPPGMKKGGKITPPHLTGGGRARLEKAEHEAKSAGGKR